MKKKDRTGFKSMFCAGPEADEEMQNGRFCEARGNYKNL